MKHKKKKITGIARKPPSTDKKVDDDDGDDKKALEKEVPLARA